MARVSGVHAWWLKLTGDASMRAVDRSAAQAFQGFGFTAGRAV